ncbi:MAG TPA: universal stress protein [Burkholderiales bacterium]|nr:universal stress protein [Burkholderiales bacterium]
MSNQLSPLGRFEKILVATDTSEFSAGALRVAMALVKKCGGMLTVMTMVKTNPEYESIAPELHRQAEVSAREHVDKVREDARAQGLEIDTLVRRGDTPDAEIVDAAEEIKADLIVMGRRGRRGIARFMVGDAVVKVIGHAHCSVLVVPKAAEMWHSRILMATDGSRYSDAAATSAAKVAKVCGLPVTVVSATAPSHSDARIREAHDAVARLAKFFADDGVSTDTRVPQGRPDEAVVLTAREVGADLIVTGTHGRTGLQKFLMGSVVERIIGQADTPILVVKAS